MLLPDTIFQSVFISWHRVSWHRDLLSVRYVHETIFHPEHQKSYMPYDFFGTVQRDHFFPLYIFFFSLYLSAHTSYKNNKELKCS